MVNISDLMDGHGEIVLRDPDGSVALRTPIRKNTITYAFGFWGLGQCLKENRGQTGDGQYVMQQIEFRVGDDVATTSQRSDSELVSTLSKTQNIAAAGITFSGTVVEEGGAGATARLSVEFSATYAAGTFNGAQTVGEIALVFRVGDHGTLSDVGGLSGGGNAANKYLMVARISAADGDFASVTPGAAQTLTITYQIDI